MLFRSLAAAKAQAEERNPNQIDGDEGEIYCVEACRKYSLRHESEFIVGKTFFEMCLGNHGWPGRFCSVDWTGESKKQDRGFMMA